MSGNIVQISTEAALRETAELADYYRNRNLILAHQLDTVRRELETVKAELEAQHPVKGDAERPTEGVH